MCSQEEMNQCQATLEELKNKGDDTLHWYLQDRANRIARQDMIDNEIQRLTAQSYHEEKKITQISNLIETFFARIYNEKPVNIGTFTLSYRKSEAVKIDDQSKIPFEYIRTPEPPAPQPDKTAIKEALKAGQLVPWATIEVRKNLQIK